MKKNIDIYSAIAAAILLGETSYVDRVCASSSTIPPSSSASSSSSELRTEQELNRQISEYFAEFKGSMSLPDFMALFSESEQQILGRLAMKPILYQEKIFNTERARDVGITDEHKFVTATMPELYNSLSSSPLLQHALVASSFARVFHLGIFNRLVSILANRIERVSLLIDRDDIVTHIANMLVVFNNNSADGIFDFFTNLVGDGDGIIKLEQLSTTFPLVLANVDDDLYSTTPLPPLINRYNAFASALRYHTKNTVLATEDFPLPEEGTVDNADIRGTNRYIAQQADDGLFYSPANLYSVESDHQSRSSSRSSSSASAANNIKRRELLTDSMPDGSIVGSAFLPPLSEKYLYEWERLYSDENGIFALNYTSVRNVALMWAMKLPSQENWKKAKVIQLLATNIGNVVEYLQPILSDIETQVNSITELPKETLKQDALVFQIANTLLAKGKISPLLAVLSEKINAHHKVVAAQNALQRLYESSDNSMARSEINRIRASINRTNEDGRNDYDFGFSLLFDFKEDSLSTTAMCINGMIQNSDIKQALAILAIEKFKIRNHYVHLLANALLHNDALVKIDSFMRLSSEARENAIRLACEQERTLLSERLPLTPEQMFTLNLLKNAMLSESNLYQNREEENNEDEAEEAYEEDLYREEEGNEVEETEVHKEDPLESLRQIVSSQWISQEDAFNAVILRALESPIHQEISPFVGLSQSYRLAKLRETNSQPANHLAAATIRSINDALRSRIRETDYSNLLEEAENIAKISDAATLHTIKILTTEAIYIDRIICSLQRILNASQIIIPQTFRDYIQKSIDYFRKIRAQITISNIQSNYLVIQTELEDKITADQSNIQDYARKLITALNKFLMPHNHNRQAINQYLADISRSLIARAVLNTQSNSNLESIPVIEHLQAFDWLIRELSSFSTSKHFDEIFPILQQNTSADVVLFPSSVANRHFSIRDNTLIDQILQTNDWSINNITALRSAGKWIYNHTKLERDFLSYLSSLNYSAENVPNTVLTAILVNCARWLHENRSLEIPNTNTSVPWYIQNNSSLISSVTPEIIAQMPSAYLCSNTYETLNNLPLSPTISFGMFRRPRSRAHPLLSSASDFISSPSNRHISEAIKTRIRNLQRDFSKFSVQTIAGESAEDAEKSFEIFFLPARAELLGERDVAKPYRSQPYTVVSRNVLKLPVRSQNILNDFLYRIGVESMLLKTQTTFEGENKPIYATAIDEIISGDHLGNVYIPRYNIELVSRCNLVSENTNARGESLYSFDTLYDVMMPQNIKSLMYDGATLNMANLRRVTKYYFLRAIYLAATENGSLALFPPYTATDSYISRLLITQCQNLVETAVRQAKISENSIRILRAYFETTRTNPRSLSSYLEGRRDVTPKMKNEMITALLWLQSFDKAPEGTSVGRDTDGHEFSNARALWFTAMQNNGDAQGYMEDLHTTDSTTLAQAWNDCIDTLLNHGYSINRAIGNIDTYAFPFTQDRDMFARSVAYYLILCMDNAIRDCNSTSHSIRNKGISELTSITGETGNLISRFAHCDSGNAAGTRTLLEHAISEALNLFMRSTTSSRSPVENTGLAHALIRSTIDKIINGTLDCQYKSLESSIVPNGEGVMESETAINQLSPINSQPGMFGRTITNNSLNCRTYALRDIGIGLAKNIIRELSEKAIRDNILAGGVAPLQHVVEREIDNRVLKGLSNICPDFYSSSSSLSTSESELFTAIREDIEATRSRQDLSTIETSKTDAFIDQMESIANKKYETLRCSCRALIVTIRTINTPGRGNIGWMDGSIPTWYTMVIRKIVTSAISPLRLAESIAKSSEFDQLVTFCRNSAITTGSNPLPIPTNISSLDVYNRTKLAFDILVAFGYITGAEVVSGR